MRTKLFLLLIFSSLTSLSYSQKLTKEDFQGLWYRVNVHKVNTPKKNYDSLHNLLSEENINANSFRKTIEKIDSSRKNTDSIIKLPETVLAEGFLTDRCKEFLDVFEISNNTAKFYSNIYYSEIIYTRRERYDLEKRYGYKFISDNEGEIYETNFKIKNNALFFKRYDSDTWVQNEIVFYKNDTLILRNFAQNLFDVYVKKKADKNINYKIQGIISYHSACIRVCPTYTAEISAEGKISFFYANSEKVQRGIVVYQDEYYGNHSGKISKKNLNELFHILSFFDVSKSEKRYCMGMPDSDFRTLTFTLDNGKEVEIKDFHFNGPPVLRVVDKMIHKFVIDMISKK